MKKNKKALIKLLTCVPRFTGADSVIRQPLREEKLEKNQKKGRRTLPLGVIDFYRSVQKLFFAFGVLDFCRLVQKLLVVVPSPNSPPRRYQLMLLMMAVMTVKICFAGLSGTDDGVVAAGAVLDRGSSPNG
ncbi:uncharacterized protein HKW66_Vig0187220 [Vigna angularis]|uniref:Uncharacterized protein n=1 Tax=Phaseolus angularis TaxID=3914 RepID=A0A8T0L0D2_PHAAN|nr:uncharacterized protein HKW66_Vig0187220 [Vigna angularis]